MEFRSDFVGFRLVVRVRLEKVVPGVTGKVIVKLDLHDGKEKQKAMKAVSSLSGIDSISMDMKDKKLTVIGDVDPVDVVSKLRKRWFTEILTVGPAKEPEKKKDEPKKDDDNKKDPFYYYYYYPYTHRPQQQHYYVQSAEENPKWGILHGLYDGRLFQHKYRADLPFDFPPYSRGWLQQGRCFNRGVEPTESEKEFHYSSTSTEPTFPLISLLTTGDSFSKGGVLAGEMNQLRARRRVRLFQHKHRADFPFNFPPYSRGWFQQGRCFSKGDEPTESEKEFDCSSTSTELTFPLISLLTAGDGFNKGGVLAGEMNQLRARRSLIVPAQAQSRLSL
ncbi:hypothetical protein Sjap_020982 [Stephania japonica]|uniref:HMA domain-containing protein n=1 Tax=Stephania japonica TaxID=461633 RepID=A0AAP0F6Z1_9MAGN